MFIETLTVLLALTGYDASYAPIVSHARTACNWHEDAREDGFLWALVAIEKASGVVPNYARGITLAATCRESRGSRRKCGDGGKSCGILQMRTWAVRTYGIDRFDPYQSAKAWLHRIGVVAKKARRLCKKRRAFLVANAWVGSGPKGYTCRYSRHWQLLRKWKQLIKIRERAAQVKRSRPSKR